MIVAAEHLRRVLRSTLVSLAGGETVLRDGCWHAPVDVTLVYFGDCSYPAARFSHQRIQFVRHPILLSSISRH